MENWFPLPFLPQKSIDKPSGAYYNVLAVTDRWVDSSAHLERGRQSLRHGYAVPPPFTQGRLSSRYTYRDVAQRGGPHLCISHLTLPPPREWQSHSPKQVHTIGRASFGLCIRAPPVADAARRQRRSGRNAAKRTASLRISGTASWGLYRPDGQHRPTQRAPFTTSTI